MRSALAALATLTAVVALTLTQGTGSAESPAQQPKATAGKSSSATYTTLAASQVRAKW